MYYDSYIKDPTILKAVDRIECTEVSCLNGPQRETILYRHDRLFNNVLDKLTHCCGSLDTCYDIVSVYDKDSNLLAEVEVEFGFLSSLERELYLKITNYNE